MTRYHHSLDIEGSQNSHAFAVVNWLKSSEEDFGFGNPSQFGVQMTLSMLGQQFFCLFKEFNVHVSFYLLTKSTLDKHI